MAVVWPDFRKKVLKNVFAASRLRGREVRLCANEDIVGGGVLQRGSELQLPLDVNMKSLRPRGNELHY